MTHTDQNSPAPFKGAWLTDIDDTLLPSGEKPGDDWIESLAGCLRLLKKHDILWAPVSGVALAKMGPRLLYRLPEDVLSHVIYYGGEGSTKSHFDFEQKIWRNVDSFQRNFTDAQAVALIGKERLDHALQAIHHADGQHIHIEKRISDAVMQLSDAGFKGSSLIDAMEAVLESRDFDKDKAETYYRGGALSWMMLGDNSVQIYKGELETEVRTEIRDFAQSWLDERDHLRNLGEDGAGMPYKHATRGIKVVLEGNDKGRAADDLIHSYQIPAQSILFVGNELFDGGNDNSVRRVPGVNILSVGEKEDPGVIDGGVQVEINQQWMDWFTLRNLENGTSWNEALEALPAQAEIISLSHCIDKEKNRPSTLTELHSKISPLISSNDLAQVILRHLGVMQNTRHALVSLRNLEYKLLARLAVLHEYHYDEARKIVRGLVEENKNGEQSNTTFSMADKVKGLLLPELKQILKTTYVDQLDVPGRIIDSYFVNIHKLSDVLTELDKLLIDTPLLDYSAEKARADKLVNNWENRIEHFVQDWFQCLQNWGQKKEAEQAALFTDPELTEIIEEFSAKDIYYYFRRLVPRLFNFPHLKDLDKPTIVLVAGTSGVGKSTVSQHVSKTLGISTYFSTDVTSRSVLRESFRYMIGDQATDLFPELYGSSFDKDTLDWFYTQSLLGMIGTGGSIDRLVKENVSAVIDGVSLIPGTLADRYFEIANIVWIVACINDEEVHYERMGTRNETGISRGGAERYRQKIKTIRNNHDRLVLMGNKADAFIADNSKSLSSTLDAVLQQIKTPYSDRGLPVEDQLRDSAWQLLSERVSKITNRSGSFF